MATIPSLPCAFWGKATGADLGATIEARPVAPEVTLRAPVRGNPVKVYGEDGKFGGPTGFEQKLVAQGGITKGQHVYFTVDGVAALVRKPVGEWAMSTEWVPGESVEIELRTL